MRAKIRLALWSRGLRLSPRTAPGASSVLYIREIGGQAQQWTIVITGRQARETWTAGQETLGEATTSLRFRDETAWITSRNAELYAVGWRLKSIRTVAPASSP